MLSDRSICEFMQKDLLIVNDGRTGDLRELMQPNSLEVPTESIIDTNGKEAPRDGSGWILDAGKVYIVIPSVSFSAGRNMPEVWAPAHAMLTKRGVVRPIAEFFELKTRRLLIPRLEKIIEFSEPVDFCNVYPDHSGRSNGHYCEDYDLAMVQGNIFVLNALRDSNLFDRLEEGEPVFWQDKLRIKAIPFPRSGVQRRGLTVGFQPEYLGFGKSLGVEKTLFQARVRPHFRTHVPDGYPFYHVCFDTNLGQESLFAQRAYEARQFCVEPFDPSKLTRFGVLLTLDKESVQRARNTKKVMHLGEAVEGSDFFEPCDSSDISGNGLFVMSSVETLSVGSGVVGFVAGRATLARRTKDKLNYRGKTRYPEIPCGANLDGPFDFYVLAGPPSKGSIDAVCIGHTTGIADSGLKAKITTVRRVEQERAGPFDRIFGESIVKERMPLLYVGFEGNDQPPRKLYGNVGNAYGSAGGVAV